MAVNISEYIPDIISSADGVPDFVITRMFIRAAREHAERSRAWRVYASVSTVADTSTVDLSSIIGEDNELVDIISIKPASGAAALTAVTYAQMDEYYSNWREETATEANWYVRDGNNTVRLIYTPSDTVTDAYYVRACYKPKLGTTSIPDLMANKFDEDLIHGAKARLLSDPDKPWTDPQTAVYHMNKFDAAIISAQSEAVDEFQTGVARKVRYGGY